MVAGQRFRPHLYSVLGVAVAMAAAISLGAAVADAALPKKGARFAGKTSQGIAIRLEMERRTNRTISSVETDVRMQCGKLGPERFFTLAVLVRVGRDGRFSSTEYDIQELDVSFERVLIDGARRSVFDVTKTVVTGRFLSGRRAAGTWRNESAIYGKRTYPSDDRPLDKCDTGLLTWSTRLRRR